MAPSTTVRRAKLDPDIQSFTLRCGARVSVSPRPGAPVAAVQVYIPGGPSLDPEGLEGLTALTGGLATQGTPRHNELELAAILEPHGCEIAGDARGLRASIVGNKWKLLLSTMGEVLCEANYPKRAVDRQKARIMSRMRVQEADPRHRGALQYRSLVYGEHWLGRTGSGTVASMERIEARHLRAHRKKHWVANRILITICGDVEPEEVERHLNRVLKDLPKGSSLPHRVAEFPERARRVAAFPSDRKQVHLYLGHLGIKRSDPDYAALVVMDHVLGTGPGFTNRIARVLRDELGLCYSVDANIHGSAGLHPGTFLAYIGTSPEHVETAVAGFQGEIRRIQEERVPDDELAVAKSYLSGSFALGFERASRRASYMVSAAVHKFPADNLERLRETFESITPEDVQRAAQAHLFPELCVLSGSGPVTKKQLRAALESA